MNVVDIVEKYRKMNPIDIEGLIRELGIELDKKAELDDNIAGQIEKSPENKFKISINKNDHYFRKRFTMAHECAHFLLHKNLLGDGVEDSKKYRKIEVTNFSNSIKDKHEVEANKFAAGLLMPLDDVRKDWESSNGNMVEFASKWQVSPKAMKIRLGLDD